MNIIKSILSEYNKTDIKILSMYGKGKYKYYAREYLLNNMNGGSYININKVNIEDIDININDNYIIYVKNSDYCFIDHFIYKDDKFIDVFDSIKDYINIFDKYYGCKSITINNKTYVLYTYHKNIILFSFLISSVFTILFL